MAFTLRLFLRKKARTVILNFSVQNDQGKKCETTGFEPGKFRPRFLYVTLHCWPWSKSVPMIPWYGHQMCFVFLWETWLEKQAETTKGYLSSKLGMSRSIRDHRSRSRVQASFLYMHCEPQELFFVVVSAVLHFMSFPFLFFFLLYSSVAQTLKNVGPLECKLCLLR